MCGVTLGAKGEHAGVLYDFFVSPREDIRAAYDLVNLVLDMGANKLGVCEVPLLTRFFEQFGFEAVALVGPGEVRPIGYRKFAGRGRAPFLAPTSCSWRERSTRRHES